MSMKEASVVEIKKELHPNADTLSLTKAFGYTVAIKSSDWNDGDLAVYIEPETFVDTRRPEFSFLANAAKYSADALKSSEPTHALIRAKKLRGIVSYGLLVPAPEGAKPGDNLYEELELVHYQPGEDEPFQKNLLSPPCYFVKYDVEHLLKNLSEFEDGEPVVVTPKLHGTSFRAVYCDGTFYAGSRKLWYNLNEDNVYCKIARGYADLIAYCKMNPGHVVYGEIYGTTQRGFDYGLKGRNDLGVFDIAQPDGNWKCPETLFNICLGNGLPHIPCLDEIGNLHWRCVALPYNLDKLKELANSQSRLGGKHVEEGIVVKSLRSPRRIFKLINPEYLLK